MTSSRKTYFKMKKPKDELEAVPDKKIGISIEDCLPRIEKLVNFYYRKFNADVLGTPLEDMYQETVYQILRTKYLDRYDYTRSVHVYLSGFIYNLFCHTFNRGMSAVSQAESIERGSEATNFSVLSRVGTTEHAAEDKQEYEYIVKMLRKRFKAEVYSVFDKNLHFICTTKEIGNYKGNYVIPHSPSYIFILLHQGLSATEIKHTLHMVPANFTALIKLLASVPEIRDWADSKGFRINS